MAGHKHVFVTGASSELMKQVISRLDSAMFTVSGLTRDKNPAHTDRISWVVGDINQSETYKTELAKADIIIHAAALTHSRNEADYFKVNYEGTKQIISAIPERRESKFVFISSRVAGEKSGGYGVSKLRAEEEVKKLKSWVIIRPSEVYGGTKSEGIEKTIHGALNGGLQFCPIGVKSKMYPIHISDTVSSIYKSAFENTHDNQTVVINGPNGYSFKELLLLIENLTGKKTMIIPVPKWFLSLVGLASKLIPINIGFVPDQVARLYSVKTHNEVTSSKVDLEGYIKELVKAQNG